MSSQEADISFFVSHLLRLILKDTYIKLFKLQHVLTGQSQLSLALSNFHVAVAEQSEIHTSTTVCQDHRS